MIIEIAAVAAAIIGGEYILFSRFKNSALAQAELKAAGMVEDRLRALGIVDEVKKLEAEGEQGLQVATKALEHVFTLAPGDFAFSAVSQSYAVVEPEAAAPEPATPAATTSPASSTSAPSNAIVPFTVPDAPTDVRAAADNAAATVTFAAPTWDGGLPITGYTVVSSPADGTDEDAGTLKTTHRVTGLKNGVAYTFTVVATNQQA